MSFESLSIEEASSERRTLEKEPEKKPLIAILISLLELNPWATTSAEFLAKVSTLRAKSLFE